MRINKKVLRPKVGGVRTELSKSLDSDQWYQILFRGPDGDPVPKVATGSSIQLHESKLLDTGYIMQPEDIPEGYRALNVAGKLFAITEGEAPEETFVSRDRSTSRESYRVPDDEPECSREFDGDMLLDTLKRRRKYSIATGFSNHAGTECKVVSGQYIRDNWKTGGFTFFSRNDCPPHGWFRLRIYEHRVYWVRPWDRDLDFPKKWRLAQRLKKRLRAKAKPARKPRKIIKVNFRKGGKR